MNSETSRPSSKTNIGWPPRRPGRERTSWLRGSTSETYSTIRTQGTQSQINYLTLDCTPECRFSKRGAKVMQIGIVAKRIGLSVDAIRFYERNALLPRAPRTQGGFRQYEENDVDTLAFIRRLQ